MINHYKYRTTAVKNGRFRQRRGAVTVEAAIMLPILVIVTMGSTDVAQYINLAQAVSNASRVGARIASRDDTESVPQVETAIRNYFYKSFQQVATGLLDTAILVDVTYPDGSPIANGDLLAIPSGDPISVRVGFNFDIVRWIRGLNYWDSDVNESTTFGRRE